MDSSSHPGEQRGCFPRPGRLSRAPPPHPPFAPQVLRFWCVWDERQTMYGDRRPYVLHYFLEDDTVEILEINENNSGRDPFPIFLKRGNLPKVRRTQRPRPHPSGACMSYC